MKLFVQDIRRAVGATGCREDRYFTSRGPSDKPPKEKEPHPERYRISKFTCDTQRKDCSREYAPTDDDELAQVENGRNKGEKGRE